MKQLISAVMRGTAGSLVFVVIFISTSVRAVVVSNHMYPSRMSVTPETTLASLPSMANPVDAVRENRITALIKKMSLEEKVSMIGGTGFDTTPIPRLGIPALTMADGPIGVRNGPQTAFPAGIAMAATFDPSLISQVGIAMAD